VTEGIPALAAPEPFLFTLGVDGLFTDFADIAAGVVRERGGR
jgi:hypothetical protein